jgi:hypothetical protein
MLFFLGLAKEHKQKIKQLLKHFMPDLFYTARGELSDDEMDKDDGESSIYSNDIIFIPPFQSSRFTENHRPAASH